MRSSVSRLLLALHRGSREQPMERFQDWALELVRTTIPFDSALWGMGEDTRPVPLIHTIHLHRQPAQMMADYERCRHEDPLARHVNAHPGVTVNSADHPEWDALPLIAAHRRRYDMGPTLCTAIVDPVSALLNFVSLFRGHRTRPFSEGERRLKQLLMPHLVEAFHANRIHFLHRVCRPAPQTWAAICNGEGTLYSLEEGFAALLGREWPHWRGPGLPAPLLVHLAGTGPRTYRGTAIVVDMVPVQDLLVLRAREKSGADRLTSRERSIAEKLIRGLSYREIAAVLDIAPATVRSHISSIYAKLDITSKAQLGIVLTQSPPPTPAEDLQAARP